jgi:ribonuclease D
MGASEVASKSDVRAAADRSDGALNQESRSHEDERGIVAQWIAVITTDAQLTELLPHIEAVDRVALDTEADSLHCYFEKLCLVQISVAERDFLLDPLATVDFRPLCDLLVKKEIVLHGADFDLRLLRRTWDFTATRIFDTVIAARLLGLKEFSLAALVQRFFDVTLAKGSQKANWARRPLPSTMAEYAMNDTHYLLPLAQKLEAELQQRGRLEWFRQSCERGLAQAGIERVRDQDDLWRITGSGALRGRAAALLRALWQWRDHEAQAADRPSFHILQNSQLIEAAKTFDAGETAEFRHFSSRRSRAFADAARQALELPAEAWPAPRPRTGVRPTPEMEKRADELRERRDRAAAELGVEPSFIAPRATLDAIAANESRSVELLVPWQQQLLGLDSIAVESP